MYVQYIHLDNAIGISVKLKCPIRAWAYLHFVNLPTLRDLRTKNLAKNSEIIFAVSVIGISGNPA